MKLSERAPAAAASFKAKARLWKPEILVLRSGAEHEEVFETVESDLYAAIDDLGGGIAVLRVSRWPNVDAWGRLAFPRGRGFPMTVPVPRFEFQEHLNAERLAHTQSAPDRPIRVGDTFLFRNASTAALLQAETRDISAAGRDMAKAAYYGAGAATVDQDYIEQMVATPATEAPAQPEAGTFDISQQALPPQGQARA